MLRSCNVVSGGNSAYRYFSDVQYSVLEASQQVTETANQVVANLKNTESEFKELLELGERVLAGVSETEDRINEEEAHRLASNYEKAESNLIKLINAYSEMENNAVCDSKLDGRNEKRVTAAFRRLIRLLKKVFETTQGIRWGIMEVADGIDEIVRSESADEFLDSLK
jgi:hypothetical protein